MRAAYNGIVVRVPRDALRAPESRTIGPGSPQFSTTFPTLVFSFFHKLVPVDRACREPCQTSQDMASRMYRNLETYTRREGRSLASTDQ